MKRYLIAFVVLVATFVLCVLVVPALAYGQGNPGAGEGGADEPMQTRLQEQARLHDGEQQCTQEQAGEQDTQPLQAQDRLRDRDRLQLQDGTCEVQQSRERDRVQDAVAGDDPAAANDEEMSFSELVTQWTSRFMAQLKSSFWRG